MPQYSANIRVMLGAVRKAAKSLSRDFGEVEKLQVSKKGPGDFVSAADIRAEEVIIHELSRVRPNYGFLLEESGELKGKDSEYVWIVDPLDGTINFLHGFPYFAVTVALERKLPTGKSEIVAAVTHAPVQQETFWAEKGCGAWMESANGANLSRLRVAGRKTMEEALLCVGSLKRDLPHVAKVAGDISGIRCIGSTALALAYVAAGRYDCFFQDTPQPWDIVAGSLLVREAGGYVSDMKGNDLSKSSSVLATNEHLHPLVLRKLA